MDKITVMYKYTYFSSDSEPLNSLNLNKINMLVY